MGVLRAGRLRASATLGTALLMSVSAAEPVAGAAWTPADAAVPPASCVGAASVAPGSACPQATSGPVVPRVEDASKDRSTSYARGCHVPRPFTARRMCVYGDPHGAVRVALVGNSHAAQWLPALDQIGRERGLRITTYFAAGCSVTTTRFVFAKRKETANCQAWSRWVRKKLLRTAYDLVIQSEYTPPLPSPRLKKGTNPYGVFVAGYRRHLAALVDAGRRVLVIRDTPRPGVNVPACLRRHPDDYGACAGPRARRLRHDALVAAARSFPEQDVRVADLSDFFCQGDTCPAVIGGVVVYFDHSHITATYARSAAPYLAEHVAAALPTTSDAPSGSPPSAAPTGFHGPGATSRRG